MVMNIVSKEEQRGIIIVEHNRAHRAAQENVKVSLQLLLSKNCKTGKIILNCKICSTAKYDRHPLKQELGITPTAEILHIDIFST